MKISRYAMLLIGVACLAQVKPPKPGFNLFSKEQDIQLGKEAAAQVEKEYEVVRNSELQSYIDEVGRKLTRSRYANDYPYTFKIVSDDTINAFALPGGPMFINTGLIKAAENEAQLAGVMGHEISHVALRHGTNQASKAQLISLPAALAGSGGGMMGTLAQLGIGLGANSVLLKFSRSAETQSDYNGTLILADAGYNPVEMARFFEKLQGESGRSGKVTEFFSSHPNPGNRMSAIQALVRQLPQKQYVDNGPHFASAQAAVRQLPPPKPRPKPAK